jgi:hypothetical protein
MSTTEIREDLHRRIDDMDERLLQAIHTIVLLQEEKEEDMVIGYDIEGNPILASVANLEYAKRLTAIKNGQGIAIEDLIEESEQW